KGQLAIKPERPRLDRLFVLVAELVRVDGETCNSGQLMKQVKSLGVDPCCLAVAISVEGVETDLHPLKEGNAFNVVDGHTVLQREAGVIGAQRQPPVGWQSPKKNLHAATRIALVKLIVIAARCAIELPIADRDGIAAHVKNLLRFLRLELANFQRRGPEFFRQ